MLKGKMYSEVVLSDMTYGQAVDAAVHQGAKVTRAVWGGYWELVPHHSINGDTEILMAILKDNGGIAPATPYDEDIKAKDWMIVV